MIIDTDKDSALGADDKLQWETILKTGTTENCCSGEHALNNVKIWSVEAGALAFDLWYELARTPPLSLSHTPSQDRSTNSSPSDIYGTFSSP
jgi:hypothetical protein